MHDDADPSPQLRDRLLATGMDDNRIRSSGYQRIRRGAYVSPAAWEQSDRATRHRLLIASTMPKLASDAAVSHASAALWRRLPLVGDPPAVVHLTRTQSAGGFRRGLLHAHVGPLPPSDVEQVGGVLVTTAGRTLHDCARVLDFGAAVVLLDDALRQGLTTREEQLDRVDGAGRKRGAGQARRVVAFADGCSESPGESLSRVSMAAAGLPMPTLQYEIWDRGVLVARTDFCWERERVVGEFDGRIKYGRLLRPGESAGDAVYREKVREDLVRALDYRFLRWGWKEAASPALLGALLTRTFAQRPTR